MTKEKKKVTRKLTSNLMKLDRTLIIRVLKMAKCYLFTSHLK